MFAQREVGILLVRAQTMMNSTIKRPNNTINPAVAAKYRYEMQQRQRLGKINKDEDNGTVEKKQHVRPLQVSADTIRASLQSLNEKLRQSAGSEKELLLNKEAELPSEMAQYATSENGEPQRKHARLDSESASSNNDSPAEQIQLDDSAEEVKPLLSPSDVSCSSGKSLYIEN